ASTKSHTANVAAPANDSAVMMLNRVSIVLFPFGRFYGSGSDSRRFRHSRRFPSFPRRRESGPWNNSNIQRLSESPGFRIPAFAGMTVRLLRLLSGFGHVGISGN
ncbi:TPA: hypothetical protein ACKWZR_002261, partial [Neisseria gonorrhoeae]